MVKNSGAKGINPKEKVGSTKPPLHLVPPVANVHEAMVMKVGAEKYGPFNWRDQPVTLSTYISAILRHAFAMADGETYDRETGQLHAAHLRANTGVVIDAFEQGTLVDDRPVSGQAGNAIERFTEKKGRKFGYVFGIDPAKDAAPPCFQGVPIQYVPQLGGFDPSKDEDYTAIRVGVDPAQNKSEMFPTELRSKIEASPVVKQAMREALQSFNFGVLNVGIDLESDVCYQPVRIGGLTATDRAAIDAADDGTVIPVGGRFPNGFSRATKNPQSCRAYISGPMRGYEKYNFPAFDAARDRLNELGVGTFSPADMDRVNGVDENWVSTGNHYDDVRTFARRDAEALLSLRPEDGDFVLVLPGWEKSTGAKAEVMLALWLGLPLRLFVSAGFGSWDNLDFVVDLELTGGLKIALVSSIGDLVVKVREDANSYRSNIGRVNKS